MVTIQVFSNAVHAAERIDRASELLREDVHEGVFSLTERLAQRLRANTPRATGRLAASTRFEVAQHGDMVIGTIFQGARNVLSRQHYLPHRVRGVGPRGALGRPSFSPPVLPFIPWVMAVMGVSEFSAARQRAFAVARSVGRRGFPPNRYNLLTVQQSRRDIELMSLRMMRNLEINVNFADAPTRQYPTSGPQS